MARRAFEMIDVIEILQHWHAGRPKTVVAASLGVDPKTVRKYVGAGGGGGGGRGGRPLCGGGGGVGRRGGGGGGGGGGGRWRVAAPPRAGGKRSRFWVGPLSAVPRELI